MDSSFSSISFQSWPFSFNTSSLGRAAPNGLLDLGLAEPKTSSFCPSPTGKVLGCKFNLGRPPTIPTLDSSLFLPQVSESASEPPLLLLKLSKEPPTLGLSSSFLFSQLSESEPLLPDSKPNPTLFSCLLGSDGTKLFFEAQLSTSSAQTPSLSPLPSFAKSGRRPLPGRPIVGLIRPRRRKFAAGLAVKASPTAGLLVPDPGAVVPKPAAELPPIELLGRPLAGAGGEGQELVLREALTLGGLRLEEFLEGQGLLLLLLLRLGGAERRKISAGRRSVLLVLLEELRLVLFGVEGPRAWLRPRANCCRHNF
ncbi:beta-lactamase-like protein [Striga asiatica]|uniref:Beta-lactamase-like protein n=1 Tax=Striga asiatica TaxID=4170 RepID=A0A5A7QAM5_STRAF|nr:beta-lactamase-like protein [Striga asiatica]